MPIDSAPPPKKPAPHHLGRTDYKRFAPVGKVFEHWPERGYLSTHAAAMLSQTPEDMQALMAELNKLGFGRVSLDKHSGAYALVVEGNDHQMVRVASKDEPERGKNPDILQPLFTKEIESKNIGEGYRIEVLPKVHTMADIVVKPELAKKYGMVNAQQECGELTRRLLVENLQRDHFLYDLKRENLGIIQDEKENNVPVILDAGAVVKLAAKSPPLVDDLLHFSACVEQDHLPLHEVEPYIHTYPPEEVAVGNPPKLMTVIAAKKYLQFLSTQTYDTQLDYAGAQESHKKSLGLDKGMKGAEYNAAISADFLEKRNPSLKETKPVYQQIIEAGASHSEFGDIARNAAPSGKGFCHDIREEAQNRGVFERK